MDAVTQEDWQISLEAAVQRQTALAHLIRQEPLGRWKTLVALAFVFSVEGEGCWAGALVTDREGNCLEQVEATASSPRAYRPGLLAYAVGPAAQQVLQQVEQAPDILLCTGHGIIHPRRCGLACQLGLMYDLPTAGCADRPLVGEHEPPGPRRGDWVPVTDGKEMVGAALRTQPGVRPIIVSSGYRLDLPGAIEVVMSLVKKYRWPEPLRYARHLARQCRAVSEGS